MTGPALDRPVDDAAIGAIAERLLAADAEASITALITEEWPAFDLAAAYEVLAAIATRRRAQGWSPVGRKIGFTNHTIWELYGVDRPMWAHVWDRTVQWAVDGEAEVALAPFVEPRIELEVVFKLKRPVPPTDDPIALIDAVEWMAPAFEIVRCPFAGWRFALPDCTAAFGLHGRLVVGEPVPVDGDPQDLADALATFAVALERDGEVVARGGGANVLGSPVLALGHLARVLAAQPESPPLAAGEIVTTGTLTDALPVTAGQVWTSRYELPGVNGVRVSFC